MAQRLPPLGQRSTMRTLWDSSTSMTQFFLTDVSPSVVTFAVDLKTPDADVLTEGLTATEGDGASALAPSPRAEPSGAAIDSRRFA